MGDKLTKVPEKADEARTERDFLIESLRRNGQLIEAEHDDVPLPPGVTHVLVKQQGTAEPRLVERRKSLL